MNIFTKEVEDVIDNKNYIYDPHLSQIAVLQLQEQREDRSDNDSCGEAEF